MHIAYALHLKHLRRYMSEFKGRVKTDISRWHATRHANIPRVGCLIICWKEYPLFSLPTHDGIIGGTPPRYVCFVLSLIKWHRCLRHTGNWLRDPSSLLWSWLNLLRCKISFWPKKCVTVIDIISYQSQCFSRISMCKNVTLIFGIR